MILNKIKQFFTKEKFDYAKLGAELDEIIKADEEEVCKAADVIEEILNKGISWYDYKELSTVEQKKYYNQAQLILDNPVFQNEMNHFIKDLVEHIAYKSKDFQEVRDLRMTINGVKAFADRLGNIENIEEKEKSTEDLNSAI